MSGIQESMAEFYSKNLAREVRKGLDVVASKGLHTGGKPPLGFDVGEDKKLIINEAEAEIVRIIFDMYANNHTYNDIVHELNLKEYKTKIGNEFTGASLSSILNNRKYIGEYVYNKRAAKDLTGKHNSHLQKPEDEIVRIPNAIPRIIDDETFEKVAKRLEANKKRTVNYQPNSSYLLTGLIYCGECGFKYQGNARAAGRGKDSIYSSYRCGKRQNHKKDCTNGEIEKNRLETFVLEQMQKYLFNSDAITVIKDLVNKHNKEMAKIKSTDLIQYEQQLKNIESQINNLTNAIARGAAEDIFIDKINTLTLTKKELQDRIDNLIVKELPPVNEENVKRAISKLQEYIKSNDNFEKNPL